MSVANSKLLHEQQKLAVLKILFSSEKRSFITGLGGTGKSEIIKTIRSWCSHPETCPLPKYIDRLPLYVQCVAPTNQAASAIDGKTYHSFFRLGVPPAEVQSSEDKIRFLNRKIVKDNCKAKLPDLLIVDEISMISASYMEFIDKRCRQLANNVNEPFGGIRVAAFGDFHQLPPICDCLGCTGCWKCGKVHNELQTEDCPICTKCRLNHQGLKNDKCTQQQVYLCGQCKKVGHTPKRCTWKCASKIPLFDHRLWKQWFPNVVRLTFNHRARDDKPFTELLERMTRNDLTQEDRKRLQALNRPSEGSHVLAFTRKVVKNADEKAVSDLRGRAEVHKAKNFYLERTMVSNMNEDESDAESESFGGIIDPFEYDYEVNDGGCQHEVPPGKVWKWKYIDAENMFNRDLKADIKEFRDCEKDAYKQKISLKQGHRIRLTHNTIGQLVEKRKGQHEWVPLPNDDSIPLSKGDVATVLAQKKLTDEPELVLEMEKEKKTVRLLRKAFLFELEEDIKIVARQFPVESAFAGTIHKAQGQTIQQPVKIYCSGFEKNANMGYVALSRAKRLDQVQLVDFTPESKSFHMNPDVVKFYSDMEKTVPDKKEDRSLIEDWKEQRLPITARDQSLIRTNTTRSDVQASKKAELAKGIDPNTKQLIDPADAVPDQIYWCTGCKQDMKLKSYMEHNEKRAHFYHLTDNNSDSKCNGETAAHQWAKREIVKRIQELEFFHNCYQNVETWIHHHGKTDPSAATTFQLSNGPMRFLRATAVEEENLVELVKGKQYRPDVTVYDEHKKRVAFVEVAETHFLSSTLCKRDDMQTLGKVLEVKSSSVKSYSNRVELFNHLCTNCSPVQCTRCEENRPSFFIEKKTGQCSSCRLCEINCVESGYAFCHKCNPEQKKICSVLHFHEHGVCGKCSTSVRMRDALFRVDAITCITCVNTNRKRKGVVDFKELPPNKRAKL